MATDAQLDSEDFGEFQQVLEQVGRKFQSESVVELAAEVSDSIKFELSQISWMQLLPPSGETLSLKVDHCEIENISGNLTFAGSSFLGIQSSQNNYLVAIPKVLWLSGLCYQPMTKKEPRHSEFELRILLQELQDQAAKVMFYLGANCKVSGLVSELYADALSIVQSELGHALRGSQPKFIAYSQITAMQFQT